MLRNRDTRYYQYRIRLLGYRQLYNQDLQLILYRQLADIIAKAGHFRNSLGGGRGEIGRTCISC